LELTKNVKLIFISFYISLFEPTKLDLV